MTNRLDIILVEDNHADAELALDALKVAHVSNTVKVLRDGQEALDYVFATGRYENREGMGHPMVILLDLNLPRVDGLDVLRRIRADDRTRDTPVVVLLAFKENRDRIESCNLGVNSYIVKPVEFENLASAVSEMGLEWELVKKAGPA